MGRRKRIRTVDQVMIHGMADKGYAVGKCPEGRVVFVAGVVPGDLVDVFIKKKTKGVLWGEPTRFLAVSATRAQPFCSHFGVCGGCKWQHLDYADQLQHKSEVVENAMKRIAKVDIEKVYPILGSKHTFFYRNKMEYSFSNKRWLTQEEVDSGEDFANRDSLGFHRPGAFDKIVDIEKCWLQRDPGNRIRNRIREFALENKYDFFDIRNQSGFLRDLIIRTPMTGELMVILGLFHEDKEKREAILNMLKVEFPEITSLNYVINPKANNTIFDLNIINYSGRPYVLEQLRNLKFKIGPKSFFQTNPRQAVALYDTIVDFADLKGTENVYDLYTGVGSIGLYLAKNCKQVVGIEEVELAIEDAKENADLNHIKNCIFYAGDVKDILSDNFIKKHDTPDLVITDPPRAGMHPKVVDILLELKAPRMVYVSCNPATQARDLFLLKEIYDVKKSRAVDMFPHTHHIENVVLLELKDG